MRALAGCTADVVVMGRIGAAFSDSWIREPGGVGVDDWILWEVALATLPGCYVEHSCFLVLCTVGVAKLDDLWKILCGVLVG